MATITQQADKFTDRDFDSWIRELRARANTAFPGWTDFNRANFGNILLEMYAHTLDVVSFYQDQQYRETRIVFARLRRSMIALGKNVSFRLPEAVAASADLEIGIADGLPRTVSITVPAGTVVRTTDLAEGVEFDLINPAVIPAGFIQVTGVQSENARVRNQAFVAPGDPNFPVQLGQIPYVGGSALITIAPSSWTEVENFLESGPTDKHFVVDTDENSRGTVRFGDGINGEIPSGSGNVTYKTGGGQDGNVEANTLKAFRDGNRFASLSGEQIQLTVRNPGSASGGVDRMSVEEARVAIPASTRTLGKRSVTKEDFEDNARKVRGVARAMMQTSNEDPGILENTGKLYVVPVGGGLPSTTLKTQVLDFINDEFPPTLTFTFTVEDPLPLVVFLEATVYLNQGVTETEGRQAVEDAVDSFFSLLNSDGSANDQIDFGYKVRTIKMGGAPAAEIPFSDLFNVIRDAALPDGRLAFRKIDEDLFIPSDDVSFADTEFPIAGPILLTNGVTALPF